MNNLEKRVQRGTALLDRMFPIWRMKVNPSQLDMGSSVDGLLEQLFDVGYFSGLAQLGLCSDEGYEYGLDIELDTDGDAEAWAELTEVWKRVMTSTILIQNP